MLCRNFAVCCVALALGAGLPLAAWSAEDLPLTAATKVRFASLDEGRAAIAARDDFLNRLSPFDLQVRLKTDQPATVDQLADALQREVLAWPPEDEARVAAAVAALREKLANLDLPLPPTVLLVCTTGKEEGEAAYTRGAAIFLPLLRVQGGAAAVETLLAHELFHVLSRHAADLRPKLYRIVGFTPCPEIELPPELAPRKITNPDAPGIDCVIELETDGATRSYAPILFSSAEKYDAARGGTLFRYLQFRLLLVEKTGKRFQPVLREGQPVLIDPRGLAAYSEKIGQNTKYVIHPDEILADNFALLAQGKKDLATPRIVEELRQALAK